MTAGSHRVREHVGIWIDHEDAVVVFAGERHVEHIPSKLIAHTPLTSGDIRDDQQSLNNFYGKIIARIYGVEAIFIMGPDRLKDDLEERLNAASLGGHVVGVERIDPMTDEEIAARVQKYFGLM